MADGVRVVAVPRPFSTRRVEKTVEAGQTIAELLEELKPEGTEVMNAHVFIGDQLIDPKLYHVVRPKPGTQVVARAIPAGRGGGGKALRMILVVVLIIVTWWAGGAGGLAAGGASAGASAGAGAGAAAGSTVASGFAGAIGMTAGTAATAVNLGAAAAISVGGMAAINAIAPIRPQGLDRLSNTPGVSDSPTLYLTGARNSPNPYGLVPRLLGRHRMVPPLGALPFTEMAGDDQYLRTLVCWGHGPLQIEDLRIGETPITEFEGVEVEHRLGFASDTPPTLFPADVFEEQMNVELVNDTGLYDGPSLWTTRTSQPGADELSIDVTFPIGLFEVNKTTGARATRVVDFQIQYRLAGDGAWLNAPVSTGGAPGYLRAEGLRSTVVRRSFRWTVAHGQYEVRIRRVTQSAEEADNRQFFMTSFWTALRTFTNTAVVRMVGAAQTVLRIKASGQLNGSLDTLNAVCTSIVPDWDAATGVWVERATSNPASLFRAVLQGPGNRQPVPDERVDLEALQDWHEECLAAGREFNMVRDFQASVWDTLSDIAAAGRATPSLRDGRWSVTRDRPQTVPIQHFTPRNSWDFEAEQAYIDPPHGFRVRFVNRDKDWRQDELIVYRDGFSDANSTVLEGLQMPGVTDPRQIWRDGRYYMAVGTERAARYTLNVDFEHLVCTRGDLVRVTHDVMAAGIGSARIASLTTDGGGNVTAITVDDVFVLETGKTYGLSIRTLNNVSLSAKILPGIFGELSTLPLETAIDAALSPAVGDLLGFGELGLETVDCLVFDVESSSHETARLSLIDYAPQVYEAELGPIPVLTSNLADVPGLLRPSVVSVQSDESVLLELPNGVLAPRVVVRLAQASARSTTVSGVELQYRPLGDSGWSSVFVGRPDALEVDTDDVAQSVTYELRLRFRLKDSVAGSQGQNGPWTAVFQHTVVGMSSLPPDVSDALLDGDLFRWRFPVVPRDHKGFRVKHISGTVENWAKGVPAHDSDVLIDTKLDVSGLLGMGTRVLMVKAVDLAGNESANTARVTVNLGDVLQNNVVVTDSLAPDFLGDLTGGTRSSGHLLADGDTSLYLPDGTDLYLGADADPYLPIQYSDMEWQTSYHIPDNAISSDRLLVSASVTGLWDLYYKLGTDPVYLPVDGDPYLPVDGDDYLPFSFATEFYPWPGSVGASPGFDAVRFKLVTHGGAVRGDVDGFDVILDAADVRERLSNVALAAGGTRLPIVRSYRAITAVSYTLQGGTTAVKVVPVDHDVSGPLSQALDASGTGVAATVNAIVEGY